MSVMEGTMQIKNIVSLFLFFIIFGAIPVRAGETVPALSGKISVDNGNPLMSYPVTITGKTNSGEDFSTFVTTNSNGEFIVMELPPGQYSTIPAGQNKGASVVIDKKPWFLGSAQKTVDVGEIKVAPGSITNNWLPNDVKLTGK